MRARIVSVVMICGLVAAPAWRARAQGADVRIDVKSGAVARLPLQCEPLQGNGASPMSSHDADEVLANDLESSAVFAVNRQWAPEAAAQAPQFVTSGTWSASGSTVRLHGELRDFPARRAILARDYQGTAAEWRQLLHRFSDDCVQQITGERGVADTRIAFVVTDGRNKELWLMDADGYGAHALTADRSIAQSPSWSPEGSLLLFTSWRGGSGPQIWVMSPEQRKPFMVSGRPGLNIGASYSPDGQRIACTLSQDGNAEVYVLDARGGAPRRLTNHRAIDTSPAWSPTGREIAFTSDRSGSPQIYVMDADGSNVRRLTFDVDYTDSPAWSPKGDRMAFVTRVGGGFDVWTCRADGSGGKPAVTGGNNENPRWSPDGRHLVFASNRDGAYGLWVTDLDGALPRKLDTGGRRALSPAWSPRRSTGP
ncbi:MAG TPA: Tol-Pal system beta propeller repeat protein TolB [Candidatus Eisenbacteria bacterium]|jgi:TolB protein